MKKRRLAAFLLCCFLMHSMNVSALELRVSAHAAALYEPMTGQFLYEYNGDQKLPMASTTKIMTALIAMETLSLDREITVKPEWVGIEGSSMYLKKGETLKVSDLLYGLLLMSGNDAAVALACLCSGSEPAFVAEMNAYALKLGLKNTHFESASGLDGDSHYSTAEDMAKLAAYAMEQKPFYDIVSTEKITIAGRWMNNHNKLLRLCEGVCGVKTGFTKKAGRCLVSACERQGRRLIFVTLNAPDDWSDHQNAYELFFKDCSAQILSLPGVQVELAVASGGKVAVYSNEEYSLALHEEERRNIKTAICGDRIVYGPVKAGRLYGVKKIILNDQIIAEIPLYFSQSVSKEAPDSFWQRLVRIFC